MKNLSGFPVLLGVVLLAVSCASVQLVTRAKSVVPSNEDQLAGKSIGIVPFEISFGASRFAVDLRGITVTIQGQSFQLQERYIAKDDDIRLGNIGILDVDILTKSKTDKTAIQRAALDVLEAGLAGAYNYHIGFFKGLGEGNMGELSNRPIDYDRSVYPPKVVFKPLDTPASPYREIRILPPKTGAAAAGTDLVLTGDISISSEVLEVLSVPAEVADRYRMDPTAKAPKPGDYYLTLLGSIRFRLTDAKTGKVIATEQSKRDWPVMDILSEDIPIPASKGDAAAYAKYFRSVDFTGIAVDSVKKALPSILPLLAPFYVNTIHQVAVEK